MYSHIKKLNQYTAKEYNMKSESLSHFQFIVLKILNTGIRDFGTNQNCYGGFHR